MPQSEAQDKTTRLLNVVSGFLQRHRLILIAALTAVAVIIGALFIYLEVRSSREQASRLAVEEVQDLFRQWNETTDQERQTQLAEEIRSGVDAIVAEYPRFYAAQRALMIRGNLQWELEQWQQAGEDFAQAATGFNTGHLTPIALFNAAAAAEQAGNPARAMELLQELVDNHDTVEVPRALFTLGRLAEGQTQTGQALDYYRRLVDSHPGSTWTNLARNRIITLSIAD